MIPMGEFVAIKMDMRSSRRIGDRERVQEQFLQVMESLNREFAPSIQARFIVTHGDEAQGMLKREFSPNVLAVMERAMEGVYPVELHVVRSRRRARHCSEEVCKIMPVCSPRVLAALVG
jgi:hypothetical protein